MLFWGLYSTAPMGIQSFIDSLLNLRAFRKMRAFWGEPRLLHNSARGPLYKDFYTSALQIESARRDVAIEDLKVWAPLAYISGLEFSAHGRLSRSWSQESIQDALKKTGSSILMCFPGALSTRCPQRGLRSPVSEKKSMPNPSCPILA